MVMVVSVIGADGAVLQTVAPDCSESMTGGSQPAIVSFADPSQPSLRGCLIVRPSCCETL